MGTAVPNSGYKAESSSPLSKRAFLKLSVVLSGALGHQDPFRLLALNQLKQMNVGTATATKLLCRAHSFSLSKSMSQIRDPEFPVGRPQVIYKKLAVVWFSLILFFCWKGDHVCSLPKGFSHPHPAVPAELQVLRWLHL